MQQCMKEGRRVSMFIELLRAGRTADGTALQ